MQAITVGSTPSHFVDAARGSRSINRVRLPRSAATIAMDTAVVVFDTPPDSLYTMTVCMSSSMTTCMLAVKHSCMKEEKKERKRACTSCC